VKKYDDGRPASRPFHSACPQSSPHREQVRNSTKQFLRFHEVVIQPAALHPMTYISDNFASAAQARAY
jgi:hypothetical protein